MVIWDGNVSALASKICVSSHVCLCFSACTSHYAQPDAVKTCFIRIVQCSLFYSPVLGTIMSGMFDVQQYQTAPCAPGSHLSAIGCNIDRLLLLLLLDPTALHSGWSVAADP